VTMGAIEVSRKQFVAQARRLAAMPGLPGSWIKAQVPFPG
jgi:leucyl/phenylalanyl-tRNA---protein transferase